MARNKKRRARIRKRVYVLFGLLIIIAFVLFNSYDYIVRLFNPTIANFILPEQSGKIDFYLNRNIYSESIYVYDIENNTVMYSKNADTKLAPASITKVMTILLACEYYQDYNASVSVSSTIFPYLWESHASVAGFEANEQVTVNDLLYGAMLPSGADATIMLAYDIAGSEDAFAELMNQKAQELGMNSTHFTNSTGLDEGDIHSTASDIAKMVNAALKNKKFKELYTSFTYLTSSSSVHPEGIAFESAPYKYFKNLLGDYQFLGSKSGFTDNAKQCLSSLVSIHGKEYIVVTLGADGDYSQDEYFSFDDTRRIYEVLALCIQKTG